MGNVLSKFRDSQRPKEKRPSNTLSAYLERALQGYWDRQGRMANEGLQMADQGAKAVQAGNMGGLAGMLLGPAAYLSSPLSALLPTEDEVRGASDLPEWSKPIANAVNTTAQFFMPGPGELGAVSPAMFLGVMAKNADRAALARAVEMEAAGKSPAVIRGETGWFKGGDEKWRFEINDATSQMRDPAQLSLQNSYPVGATLRHDELYANYPELRQIKVHPEAGAGGGMNLAERELYLGTGADLAPEIRNDYVKSVALHELQHAVQGIEGFAGGAGKSTAVRSLDDYRRAAGEVEARNVQRRMNWSDTDRKVAPWVTEDIPREQQTFNQSQPFERAYALPPKGLGRGMAQLADSATDAERAALGSRLEAEAAQTGGQASTVTRDQALRNLTEAPDNAGMKVKINSLKEAQDAHKRAVEIGKEYGFTPSDADMAYTGSTYQDLMLRDGKKYSIVAIRSADHPEPASRINNGFGANFSFEPHGSFDEDELRRMFAAKREKLGLPPIEPKK